MPDDPRCTACGSDLDANDGAHFHGCGNAGRYADEPPTIACGCQRDPCEHCPGAIVCVRCGAVTQDPDRWDPEADTGRIFCDRCWPLRHDDAHEHEQYRG